jgi:hypothetical protein
MGWFAVLAGGVLLAGCVERRFVVISDPATAVVYENGRPLGAAPADDHFTYYGTYHFTLVKPDFQTLQVDQPIPAPWYEYPGLDFISENLIPWTIRDVREFHYHLVPLQVPNARQLLEEGEGMRARGKAIPQGLPGTGSPPAQPVAVPPAPQ